MKRLLDAIGNLIGVTDAPRRDPRIPDLVGLHEAMRILGLKSRTSVHKRATKGQLMGARLDGGTGDWVFRRSHIEWVAAKDRASKGEAHDPGPEPS